MSVVLGVDPGFASFGLALVQLLPAGERVLELGVLRTAKDPAKRHTLAADDNIRRAREIALGLDELILKHRPVAVAAEAMSFPRSSSVAGKMCMAWGVLCCLCQRYGLPIVQASPQAIKLAVTGSKTADKDVVQAALVTRYGAEVARLVLGIPKGQHEHPFDALGAVVAALQSDVVRLARQMAKGAA